MIKPGGASSSGSTSGAAEPSGAAPAAAEVLITHKGKRVPQCVVPSEAGYSAEEARQWSPPGCNLSKQTHWHYRWRAKANYLGERSKSVVPSQGITDFDAMVWVLTLAWHKYSEFSGEPCPFDFKSEFVPKAAPDTK